MTDRCVHAVLAGGTEVVRYQRQGRWYLEAPERPRRPVAVRDAAALAATAGATVTFGLPGGTMFDAIVRGKR